MRASALEVGVMSDFFIEFGLKVEERTFFQVLNQKQKDQQGAPFRVAIKKLLTKGTKQGAVFYTSGTMRGTVAV